MSQPNISPYGQPAPGGLPLHAKATMTVHASDLFPTTASSGAYEKTDGLNGFGEQATFRVYTDGDPTSGLEVHIDRGTGVEAARSNGIAVTFSAGALDATYTPADKTLEITAQNATNLGALRTELNGITGLTSAATDFFGSGAAADAWDRGTADTVTAGGGGDRWAWFRITMRPQDVNTTEGRRHNSAHVVLGTAAPANNDAADHVVDYQPYVGVLPPGEEIYLRSTRAADHPGSVALWVIPRAVGDFI